MANLNHMGRDRVFLEVVQDAVELFGAQVRAARAERRWTAAELARRAGVSKGTVLKVEQGHPGVSIGTAFQLAALVGVPLFARDERRLAADAQAARAAVIGRRVRRPAEPDVALDF